MTETRQTLFGEITVSVSNGKVAELAFSPSEPKCRDGRQLHTSDIRLLNRAFKQLDEYFSGKRQLFDLPLQSASTRFQQRVRDTLLCVGFGETVSYGELAQRVGMPGASRAVGSAMRTNPIPILVPCHRVLAAGGKIGGYSSGLEIKRRLLNLEKYAAPGYWDGWTAEDNCVLLYLRIDGKILLIRKKRGLGKGKVNGPGGHIEQGETPLMAAIRETQEEVGLTPLTPKHCGTLQFAFLNGYTERCEVFQAEAYEGTLRETDEAEPFWCDETAIPLEQMWADDRYWFPLLLRGKRFHLRYVFDDDRLLFGNTKK